MAKKLVKTDYSNGCVNIITFALKGTKHNQPTQKAMELGLFKVKERTINNPDGSSQITVTTKVTGKGQQYFINRFLSLEPSQLSLEIESI